MKTLKTQLTLCLLALTTLLVFSGCDDDIWWEAGSADVYGEWRIAEVTGSYDCNYRPGDYWVLYGNGRFLAEGDGGLYETGSWERRGRTIYIYFNSYDPEVVARVRSLDDYYMILDVDDCTYGSRYTLRMTRQSYYYSDKQQTRP